MIVEVVTASLSHSRAIWQWRNDPVTRSMFRSEDLISWECHSNWYQKTLANPNRIMYVAITEQLPIGVVRFDSINNLEGTFEISININPLERSKGLGLEVLKNALYKLKQERPGVQKIIAEVKKENPASNRLFVSCGFIPQQTSESGFNSYFYTYNLRET